MSALFLRHPGEKDLALFAGGELGPVSRWRIEGHLNGCAQCRQAVSEYFETRSKVMDLAETPAVDWDEMTRGIHLRLVRERAEPRPAALWRPAWGAALALLILTIAGLSVNRLLQPPKNAVWLDASAGAVELRVGGQQVLTLVNAAKEETPVNWRVSADAVSARYFDADTGNITVNNVNAQ